MNQDTQARALRAGVDILMATPGIDDGNVPEEAGHRSLLATREMGESSVEAWACHVLLGSSSEISGKEALARAIDFAGREPPRLEVGSWVPVRDSGTGKSGFDPATGCYRIAPDKGRVRLVIDGRQHPYFYCAATAQAIAESKTDQLRAELAQLVKDANLPAPAKVLIPILQAILDGCRDATLADNPDLHYTDAVEVRLLIETLAARA